MSLVFYAGVVITLVGLIGILWFIRGARRLKKHNADDRTIHAELRSLVSLNIAAFGLAFLGLAVALVGLILAG